MKTGLATYTYKKEFGGDGETKLGFIAEEMPKDVLSKDGKGVDVYELLSYSIGAMKAQQEEIKAQQEEMKAQGKKIEAMARELKALKGGRS
ncbi:MAG: hypothetical protein HZA01_05515 [Nitrospinae bacterium]|nr:hypothetical protein [Nitrospinota bacterium]